MLFRPPVSCGASSEPPILGGPVQPFVALLSLLKRGRLELKWPWGQSPTSERPIQSNQNRKPKKREVTNPSQPGIRTKPVLRHRPIRIRQAPTTCRGPWLRSIRRMLKTRSGPNRAPEKRSIHFATTRLEHGWLFHDRNKVGHHDLQAAMFSQVYNVRTPAQTWNPGEWKHAKLWLAAKTSY